MATASGTGSPRLRFERALHRKGIARIAGVDEAGRGPLAGPVVAAAVILPRDFVDPSIDDSKKLTAAERERLFDRILKVAAAFAIRSAEAHEIEATNILRATKRAMRDAVVSLSPAPEYVLLDALTLDGLRLPQRGIVRGDARSQSIAAASILAKVWRDRHMEDLARRYPAYGFERHKGYATEEHREAVLRHGPCPEHRPLFLRKLLGPRQTALPFGDR